MRDSYDADPEETTKTLRRVRARDSQLWGRRIATADVTPMMIAHSDVTRCICDTCDGKRVQPNLPPALTAKVLVNRKTLAASISSETTDSVGSPYGKRKPNRLNQPVTAPVWSTFLNKVMK